MSTQRDRAINRINFRVLGALPLAIAAGAAAESRQQIDWGIVGGMTLGTLLTLFVVPAFYTVFARVHQKTAHTETTNDPPTISTLPQHGD